MSCSPQIKLLDNYTCFTHDELKEIAKAFNKYTVIYCKDCKEIGEINTKTKKELWKSIYRRLRKVCIKESCWIDQDFINMIKNNKLVEKLKFYTFKPKPTKTLKTWLNTNDINNVLNQYQLKYPNFKFNGALPSDFWKYSKIDYSKMKMYDFIGFVINLDAHDKPGSHWVTLFVDNKQKTIEFFDSLGHVPNKNIKIFISKLQESGLKKYKVLINRKIHQQQDFDCGVYCIYYIIQRLYNKTFKDITKDIIKDSKMKKYRKFIFNYHF